MKFEFCVDYCSNDYYMNVANSLLNTLYSSKILYKPKQFKNPHVLWVIVLIRQMTIIGPICQKNIISNIV